MRDITLSFYKDTIFVEGLFCAKLVTIRVTADTYMIFILGQALFSMFKYINSSMPTTLTGSYYDIHSTDEKIFG